MLINSLNIHLFDVFVVNNSLTLEFFNTNNTRVGIYNLNLITERFKYNSLNGQRGYFFLGNKILSNNIVFCNDIVYFLNSYKHNLPIETTLFIFSPGEIYKEDIIFIKGFLNDYKVYTFFKKKFQTLIFDGIYENKISIDSDGNYLIDNRIIPFNSTLTEIHTISKLRTPFKHIR